MTMDPRVVTGSRRIVVTTFGSLGDVYPYVAVALGLRARGHDVVVATGTCYRHAIESLGLGFRAVRPDCDWVADPAVMRRLTHPQWGLIRVARMQLPAVRESYEDTLAAADGADLLVGNLASYATRLVAETRGLPWASAMHIPLLVFSAHDPPLLPGFPGLSTALRPLGPAFWRPLSYALRRALRHLARPWYRLRAQLGLPPANDVNPLTDGYSPALHLALFSRLLAAEQADWPAATVVTGFPWFDVAGSSALAPNLERFLNDGPPPVVFTLGSAVATVAGPFFAHSAAAAKQLGRRAVLVLGNPRNRPATLPAGVIAVDYAPYAELFPRAAAVVHHGGIGTTALAMRAGRPVLVMPCAWDQPDNAARAARLGVARSIPRHRYSARRAAAELRHLLDDPTYSRRAAEVGAQVRQEDGVRVACDAICRLLPAVGPAR